MPIRKYKPTSPGRRSMSVSTFEEVTKSRPEKSLIEPLKSKAGRNNHGRITTRHQGGGHKRFYRIIDFKRNKIGIPARIAAIEYDPNRSARIALLFYADGEKRYMLAPVGLGVGDGRFWTGVSDSKRQCVAVAEHSHRFADSQYRAAQGQGRTAGSLGRRGRSAAWPRARTTPRSASPSGEVRRVHIECMATLGQIGNVEHENIEIGKAGRSRWMGKRPTVRGSVMNPRDHPHGGGEGKAPIGGQPKTKWGKPAFQRTRNNKRTDSHDRSSPAGESGAAEITVTARR